jgi:hypothetical protein
MDEIKQIPDVKNKLYKDMNDFWKLSLLSYEGGKKYIEGNITKHSRESSNKYQRRVEQAFNINFTQKFVQILTSFISQGVVRQIDIGEGKDNYLDKIDFFRTAKSFFTRRLEEYLLTGDCLAVADAYENERAFLHNVNVLNIMDWKTNGRGYEYVDVWIGEQVIRYTKDEIKIADIPSYNQATATFKEPKPNAIQMLPIVSANGFLTPMPAYFRDAIYLCRNIFLQMNSIAFQYTENNFAILAHPMRKTFGKTEPADKDYNDFDPHDLSHIVMPDKDSPLPSWITQNTDHLAGNLEFVVQQVKWLMSMLNIYNTESGNLSGDAKSYDYSLMVGVLKEVSKVMQEFEINCWWMMAQYDAKIRNNWEKIVIQYPTEFDVKALKTKLDEFALLFNWDISDTFNKEIRKQVAELYIRNDEKQQAIFKEIDTATEPEGLFEKEGENLEE